MAHKPLLLSKRVAEVATVAIGTDITSKDHPADLCLIAGVADDWAELLNAMSKLTVITIWACAGLLPFVAQFSLEHPLVVHFQLKWLLLLLTSFHIHFLLHNFIIMHY